MRAERKEAFRKMLIWTIVVGFSLAWGLTAALAEDSVRVTGLTISGKSSVSENSTEYYTATARYSNGTTKTVTSQATWSENSRYASFVSKGALKTGSVNSNQTVKVVVSYTYGGRRLTAAKYVTILNGASSVSLTGLSITGPSTMNESTSASFTATASFNDGTTRDVSSSATWSENSAFATIGAGGVLAALAVTSNQTVTVTASYASNGVSRTATQTVTIVDVPSIAALTTLSISGASTVNESTSSAYKATAAFSDNTTRDVTAEAVWSENSAYAGISTGGVLSAAEVTGSQTVDISASYGYSGISKSAAFTVTIVDTTTPPPPPPVSGSHAGRFSAYEGTKTCLQCHTTQANEMHGSVHYQWKGDTVDLVNPAAPKEGKFGSINDFCIYPDINWIGKVTNVDGAQVDGGCAKCHVGLGDKPSPTVSQAQLENIDCLLCHSPSYKRHVDLVNGLYKFVPDTTAMTVSVLEAASDIKLPNRDICLNCHTKSGGGNNFKRGDIEEAHRNPPSASFDVHMASTAMGGKGLECLNCHTSAGHRMAGRGSDLKGRDSLDALNCQKCHSATPHSSADINKHMARVNCTVCHIPTFAKVGATDMERDWSVPGELDTAKRLYDPFMTRQTNVLPVYKFWSGKSQFYNFGDVAVPGPSGRVMMSTPVGDVTTSGAKIYAFKYHMGIQPVDTVTRKLLPLKIGLFYTTGQIQAAVAEGQKAVGWPANPYGFENTERYMGLFHEVAPKSQALQCNSCHNGGARLDFAALGYTPKTTRNGAPLCSSCHSSESASFSTVHNIHVTERRYDCSQCHNFSKAN